MQKSTSVDSCPDSNVSKDFSQGKFGPPTPQKSGEVNILKADSKLKRSEVVVMDDGDQSLCSGEGSESLSLSTKKKDRGVSFQ